MNQSAPVSVMGLNTDRGKIDIVASSRIRYDPNVTVAGEGRRSDPLAIGVDIANEPRRRLSLDDPGRQKIPHLQRVELKVPLASMRPHGETLLPLNEPDNRHAAARSALDSRPGSPERPPLLRIPG